MHQTFAGELQVQQVLYEYVHQGRKLVILQTQQVVAAPSQALPYKILQNQSHVQRNHAKLFIMKIHTQLMIN